MCVDYKETPAFKRSAPAALRSSRAPKDRNLALASSSSVARKSAKPTPAFAMCARGPVADAPDAGQCEKRNLLADAG